MSTAQETTAPAQAAKWSNGSALTSKLVSVLVLLAVLCGPLALFIAHGAQVAAGRRPAVNSSGQQFTASQQSTGAFSIGFVAAWLGASQADSTALSNYVSQIPATLSTTPFAYRNLAVASIQTDTGPNMVTVIVSGDVQDPQLSTDHPVTWPRRYYQVTVQVHGTKLTATGLPAPVAGPATSTDSPNLGYGTQLPTTDKAGQTVTLFLAAYLSGQGATEPYVSPASTINAIKPAPFTQVTPVSYTADQAPASSPADGDQVQVLATVTLQNAVGQSLTASYALELRARAGRWEIRAIQPAPVLAESNHSTSTSHSSTTSGSQKGSTP